MSVSSGGVSLTERFAMMVTSRHLRPGTDMYRNARDNFIVSEFEQYFGEETKLLNWQKLCMDLGIEGPPGSIRQCRKALEKTWVNIWDLVEAVEQGEPVKTFKSHKALANYTRKEGKFYPKKTAKQYGPIKALLTHIN